MRGLNGDQTSLALRLGAVLILTPAYTNAVAGATALNVAGGMSGFAGMLAPELALSGVAAQSNAIEEAFGQLVGPIWQRDEGERLRFGLIVASKHTNRAGNVH